VVRLCQNCSTAQDSDLTRSVRRRYGHCEDNRERSDNARSGDTTTFEGIQLRGERYHVNQNDNTGNNDTIFESKRKKQEKNFVGCRTHGEKLMVILREVVNDALLNGRVVHLTGHSLGGGLATLLALDIVINFPHVPVSKLYVWTFGAPQVTDDVFLRSAVEASPRLRSFVEKGSRRRFHRFVTLSDKCKVDFISTFSARALPSHKRNIRGHVARRLGGVRGNIVHFADPHYLSPSDYRRVNTTRASTNGASPTASTTTKSTVEAHLLKNYLRGISRESIDHPLCSDLPLELGESIGEVKQKNRTAHSMI